MIVQLSGVPASRSQPASDRSDRGAVWLFGLFLAATLIGPATPVNKVPFALMFLSLLWDQWRRRGPNPFPSLAPAAIVAIFLYGFGLSLINRVDMPIAVQLVTAPLVLLLVYFVVTRRIDFDRLAVGGSILVLICTALFWLAIVTPGLPFGSAIYLFFINYNFSAATDREFFEGGATFTLQLGTAPFLFVGYCVTGMRLFSPRRRVRDGALLVLILVGILASGLRGLVGITVLYTAYLAIQAVPPRHRVTVLLGLALAGSIFWLNVISSSPAFSAEEESNSVKLGHFASYLHQLNWTNGLFGEGLASYYFSSGSHGYKSYTELTPIDMCRYLGIPLTLVLYALLFFPLRGLWRYTRNRGGYTLAMLLFTVLSMTNPVMFNSYGLMVVVWYWCSLQPLQRTRPAAPPALPPGQTA